MLSKTEESNPEVKQWSKTISNNYVSESKNWVMRAQNLKEATSKTYQDF